MPRGSNPRSQLGHRVNNASKNENTGSQAKRAAVISGRASAARIRRLGEESRKKGQS